MTPVTVIDLQESRYWAECPMCDAVKRLDHAVGWYEEAMQEDIGTILPHGGEVCGMSVCKQCHDAHYENGPKQDAPGGGTDGH